MFWKDVLARKILAQAEVSYSWLHSLQDEFPSLRVKTIDAKGRVPVIQISERSEWVKPKEWADNHVTALKQRYKEQHARLVDVGCDPSELCRSTCTLMALEDKAAGNDLAEVSKLRAQKLHADKNYLFMVDQLRDVCHGLRINLDLQQFLIEWDPSKPEYYLE